MTAAAENGLERYVLREAKPLEAEVDHNGTFTTSSITLEITRRVIDGTIIAQTVQRSLLMARNCYRALPINPRYARVYGKRKEVGQ